MLKLEIPKEIYDKMTAQARREAPVEACGILAGRQTKVETLYEMTNVDNSHDHYMMAPEEQFDAVKDMRATGREMLGIYHSHPATPARPSQEDIRLALTPDVVYVILSLQHPDTPEVKGYDIKNSTVNEVPVVITRKER
jgi:proteasome lid subunit RPN8/RPN11